MLARKIADVGSSAVDVDLPADGGFVTVKPKIGDTFGGYALILELVTGLLAVLYAATLVAAYNHQLPVDRIIMLAVGVMFIVMGNYLGRVKRNWTMGVRFSWTLSDDTVWFKTNRLGGRLFMLAGVLGVVGAALPSPWNIAMLIVPVLLVVPVTYVYSWRLYRKLHPEEMASPGRV